LSGYLIGGQLWKEYNLTHNINYKQFFIKRSLRIWPLYYFLILLFLIIRGPLNNNWLFSDLYFLSNYLPEGAIKGSWSLSIEEQFYLFFPLLLIMAGKLKFTIPKIRLGLIIFFLLAPLIRFYTLPNHNLVTISEVIKQIYYPFHTHPDGLLIGLILSSINFNSNRLYNWKKVSLILIIFTLIFTLLRLKWKIYFNYSMISLIFGTLLWLMIHYFPKDYKLPFAKIWETIAKLSFGIYLIHYQILKYLTPMFSKLFNGFPEAINYTLTSVLIFSITLLLSQITYSFLEKPSMNLRSKILKKLAL